MSNLKPISGTHLIPSTNRDMVLTESKQAYGRFLEVYESIGGQVNAVTMHLIKQSIEEHGYTVKDIEEALFVIFESGEYVNWGNLKKHIGEKFNPETYDQHYGAVNE